MIISRPKPQYLASMYYFLFFGAIGGLIPYLNLYYQELGMETWQIGVLAALMTASTLFAGPMWSAIADIFHIHQRLLPLLMLLTLPLAFVMSGADGFYMFLLLILLFGSCMAPVISLADNAVLAFLGDKQHEYGYLRIWGSVGWSISVWGTGWLIERTDIQFMFLIYISLMVSFQKIGGGSYLLP